MAYFKNATVNLLNLHYGIFSVVITGAGAFVCVFLLKDGVPLPGVLAAMAAILLARFAIRPVMVGFAVRFGLKRLLIAGTLLMALQFPVLALVHGAGATLYLLILISAIGDTVYWPNYHAYFAATGDPEHRGRQVSVREAIAAMVGVVSPLITGWILVTAGPFAAFGIAGVTMVLASLPLLWTPQVAVTPSEPGAYRAARFGIKMFVIDGWIGSGFVFVWQIALFLSLKENYLHYGGALAIAALVGAIGGLLLGRHIDAGHGSRAVAIALSALGFIVVIRAIASGHPALAVIANAFTYLGACLYIPTLMTAVYNEAKRSPCTLRFHVVTEGGWDAGGALGSLAAALLIWLGVPISWVLLLPLIGVIAAFVSLRRYYASNAVAIEAAAPDPLLGR